MLGMFETLVGSFALSALAGAALLLRSKRTVTARSLLASILVAGLLGFGLTALLFGRFGDTDEGRLMLLGISCVSGLAGISAPAVWDAIRRTIISSLGGKSNGGSNYWDTPVPDSDA